MHEILWRNSSAGVDSDCSPVARIEFVERNDEILGLRVGTTSSHFLLVGNKDWSCLSAELDKV